MQRTSYAAAVAFGVVSLFLWAPAPTRGQAPRRLDIQIVDGREAVAGEALVKFRQRMRAADLTRLAPEVDADEARPLGRTGVVRVRSKSLTAAALVARLARRGDVAYAEPNYIVRAFAPPNDVSFSQLWGLDNVGQVVNGVPGVAGADIDAAAAWDISVGSRTHVVAVIDTGIDYTHPDLAANIWSAPAPFTVTLGGASITCAAGTHGYNAIARNCNPMDDHHHGTHVAGTIGAVGNNGIGVAGVNWTASIMAIKFLDASGSGSIADAIDGIHFAVQVKQAFAATGGADIRVLSNSWGGSSSSQALLDEIYAADAQDMLFVAAAGNNGFDNDLSPTYPASHDAPNVVAVAATTNQDGMAWFSNYGAESVDLGAPGMDILSTTIGNTYAFASGTSMAAPHVSGAAALVLSRCALDTAALKDTLLGSVEPVPDLESTTSTGGRLNVNSAIHACIAPPDTPASLTARGGNTRVTLTWSASLGAIGYNVKRSLAAGGPYTPIASAVRGVTYVDTAVVNGTTYYYVVSAENTLGESSDSNEASATPNIPPDLILSAFTVPATAGAGSTLSVSVTTKNQGTGTAAPSTTRLYLSVNAIAESGDLALAEQLVPELLGGASVSTSLSITIPTDLTVGRYFVIATADADDVLSENLETNNAIARQVQVGPDLTVSSFTVPATAAAGATLSLTDTVKNQGGGDAAASSTSFYLSSNGTLGTGDVLLGNRAVPALGAGVTNAGSTTLTIPATTSVGTYFVLAIADGELVVAETVETNNSIARAVQIGGDLVVSTFLAPSTAGPGSTIAVTDTTKNQGAAPTPESVTRFYLSVNSVFDATDTPLDGGRPVPDLAPGALSSGPTSLTIPPTVTAGAYYLLAKADADNAVAETQENNNVLARSIKIGSDLVVSTLTVPAKAEAGTPIAVSDTTTNQGAGAAAATTTRFYLSANSVLDASDLSLGGRPVPALVPAASDSASTTLTIPVETTAGAYYLIAKADADAVVVETLESNNTAARPIQIGGDLQVTGFSAPAKGGAGAPVTVSETTVNQGSVAVGPTTTRFYLSPNTLFDATDILLAGSRAIPGLAAGGSSAGSTAVTIPANTATGTYFIFARADADDLVPETLETNNTASRTIQIGSDLALLALTTPAKAAAGQPVVVSDTTTNQGGGDAPVSVTEFYLSTNTALGAEDTPIGSRVVGDLAAGSSNSGATTVTIPGGAGAGTFYIIAKADADNTVAETVEANNTTARLIKIGPDLTVSIVTVSPSTVVAAGASVTVTDTVANSGAEAAAPTTTRFYLSTNLMLDANDTPLTDSRSVPQIDPNGASSGSTAVAIPAGTAPGNYLLLAKADADGSVAESSESNNVAARTIKVIAAP